MLKCSKSNFLRKWLSAGKLFFSVTEHEFNHHKFIILESSLLNEEDIYHVKVRHTQSFFKLSLEEILSDTHLLFNLPPEQSCSIAMDACQAGKSNNVVSNKADLAQEAALRSLNTESTNKEHSLTIIGYGEKSVIKFRSVVSGKSYKETAIKLIKSGYVVSFLPQSAFIIGCIASMNQKHRKPATHLRLIA